jgi:hypothetical protein
MGMFETAVRAKKSAPAPDTVAPAKVTDLSLQSAGATDAVIQWTTAGDDGFTGTAAAYDVRYAGSTITTEGAWDAATSLFGPGWTPNAVPGGSLVDQYVVDPGFGSGVNSYWVVRYRDEAGNMGPISTVLILQWF